MKTHEEYYKELEELKAKHAKEIKNFVENWALATNPYKAGDIVEDHVQRVRITGYVRVEMNYPRNDKPILVYRGDNLTKKNEVKKREPVATIYQSNIKRKINE